MRARDSVKPSTGASAPTVVVGAAVAMAVVCAALVILTSSLLDAPSPVPQGPVARVGDVEIYRVGVTTTGGRAAECYVTSAGGIHCLEPVEDSW